MEDTAENAAISTSVTVCALQTQRKWNMEHYSQAFVNTSYKSFLKEVYTVSTNTTNSFHIGSLIASADFIQFSHHKTIMFYKYNSLNVTPRYIVQTILRHVINNKTAIYII